MPVAVGRCSAVGSSCVFSGVLRIHSIALRILGRIFTPPRLTYFTNTFPSLPSKGSHVCIRTIAYICAMVP